MEVRTGIVTGSKIVTHPEATAPGRVLHVALTSIEDVQTVQTCQAGEEFSPTGGCVAVVVPGVGQAYKLAAAIDDCLPPVMDPGGKRIYATDPQGNAEVAEVRLYPDGRVQAFNEQAHVTLAPSGAITVGNDAGGATLSAAGVWTFHGTASHFDHPVTMASTLEVTGAISSDESVTAPTVEGATDVVFAGKSAVGHKHQYVSPVGVSDTGVPN